MQFLETAGTNNEKTHSSPYRHVSFYCITRRRGPERLGLMGRFGELRLPRIQLHLDVHPWAECIRREREHSVAVEPGLHRRVGGGVYLDGSKVFRGEHQRLNPS